MATPSVLRIKDADGERSLHWALEHHDDPEVIKLVISRLPPALVTVVGDVRIWEFFKDLPAENRSSNDVEIHGLLVYSYVAYKQHRFPRLIELCGSSKSGALRGRPVAARALLKAVLAAAEHYVPEDGFGWGDHHSSGLRYGLLVPQPWE